jgi:hypothetical protein
MNKLFLMLLGCLTFCSLIITATQPVSAGPLNSVQYVEITKSGSPQGLNLNPISPDEQSLNNDDRIGDLAISKFGCDCAGCRRAIAQMLSSSLSPR